MSINGSDLMFSDEFPQDIAGIQTPLALGGTTATISLNVNDADTWLERAVEAGAEVLRPLTDEFYGRSGKLRDPFGHVWGVVGPSRT